MKVSKQDLIKDALEAMDTQILAELKSSGNFAQLYKINQTVRKGPEYKNKVDVARKLNLDRLVAQIRNHQEREEDYDYYIAYLVRTSSLKRMTEAALLPEVKEPPHETVDNVIDLTLIQVFKVPLPTFKLEEEARKKYKKLPASIKYTDEDLVDEIIRNGMFSRLSGKINLLLQTKGTWQGFVNEMPFLFENARFKDILLKIKKTGFEQDAVHDAMIAKFIIIINLNRQKQLVDLVEGVPLEQREDFFAWLRSEKEIAKTRVYSHTFFIQAADDPNLILKIDENGKSLENPLTELRRIVDQLKHKPKNLDKIPLHLEKLKNSEKNATFWKIIRDGFTQGHGELFLSILKKNGAYDVLFPSLTDDVNQKQENEAWFEERVKQIDSAYRAYHRECKMFNSPTPVKFYSSIIETSLIVKELSSHTPEHIHQAYQMAHVLDDKFKQQIDKLQGKKVDYLAKHYGPKEHSVSHLTLGKK